MCIHHVQIFQCPSPGNPSGGRAGGRTHTVRSNILCSDNFACPDSQLETRTSQYDHFCPSCTGEAPSVPRGSPQSEQWQRDVNEDAAWAHSFVGNFARSAILWTRTAFPAADVDMREVSEVWYRSLFLERRCKEKDHGAGKCRCEANGPLGYMHNAAAAARRHLTDQAAEKFDQDPRWQDGVSRQVLTDCHMAVSGMCREQNLFFKGGVSRQPLFSAKFTLKRMDSVNDTVDYYLKLVQGLILDDVKNKGTVWTHAHSLQEQGAQKRSSLVRWLAEILAYDNGIGDGRFGVALERLGWIIVPPEFRNTSGIDSLEMLAEIVSSIIQNQTPSRTFYGCLGSLRQFFASKREEWHVALTKYKGRKMIFESNVDLLDSGDVWPTPQAWGKCPICHEGFWDPPNTEPRSGYRETPAGVHMSDGGEPPVLVRDCRHYVGRNCLFNAWVRDPRLAHENPKCPEPGCKGELTFLYYQLHEVSRGFDIRMKPPGVL
ncbi:hypothetical protein CCHL11_09360 [Colletotrichum chlorophyti]|uniref:Uncharacterized protein n=1 Tax=Colletotrichum chlorophyti TaxID=708187 RepID=A0A1Q8RPP7_9PEZI|nr:hypothetical protein CCHL11_09360 [Colletotrichum chlorophyti]